MQNDFVLGAEKPFWPLSTYAPYNFKPNLISEIDISPEELRVKFVECKAAGILAEYYSYEASKIASADQIFNNAKTNVLPAYEQALKHHRGAKPVPWNKIENPETIESGLSSGSTSSPAGVPSLGLNTSPASTVPAIARSDVSSSFGQTASPQLGAPSASDAAIQSTTLGSTSISQPNSSSASAAVSQSSGSLNGSSAFATAPRSPLTGLEASSQLNASAMDTPSGNAGETTSALNFGVDKAIALDCSSELERCSTFYFELVVFQVEKTLFKVPLHGFLEGSPTFSAKYLAQYTDRNIYAGSTEGESQSTIILGHSDEFPIDLTSDVSKTDFRRFLENLCPSPPQARATKSRSKDEWTSVLKVATLWKFNNIRTLAIENLEQYMSSVTSVDKILLGREFHHQVWLSDGLHELITRGKPLDESDFDQLGTSTCCHIVRERELCLGFGHRKPGDVCDVHEHRVHIRETFKADLERCADAATSAGLEPVLLPPVTPKVQKECASSVEMSVESKEPTDSDAATKSFGDLFPTASSPRMKKKKEKKRKARVAESGATTCNSAPPVAPSAVGVPVSAPFRFNFSAISSSEASVARFNFGPAATTKATVGPPAPSTVASVTETPKVSGPV
jgi:hypothetical protein